MGNSFFNIKTRGFTLAELLIFMIISGLVLLLVFEGFSLFRKHAYHKTQVILKTMEVFDRYNRLVDITLVADSVAVTNMAEYTLFSNKECLAVLSLDEGVLKVTKNAITDTIFTKVSDISLYKAKHSFLTDSLIVNISHDTDKVFRMALPIYPLPENKIVILADEKESPYKYYD